MNEFEKYKEKQRIADEGIQHIMKDLRHGKNWTSSELNKEITDLVKKIMSIGAEDEDDG